MNYFKLGIIVMLAVAATAAGQNRFEGYSFVLKATSDGACPMRYLPQNEIDVYLAGTNRTQPATGLAACDGSQLSGSHVRPNGIGKWCFQGAEEMYEVRLSDGSSNLWYPLTKDSGIYNVKDFRPVTRTGGANPKYVFTDPPDYSRAIQNAATFIAARQGGTLQFPDGDYIVGTTDGNTRDPSYEAITLPSGIIVQGVSSNMSVTSTNQPTRNTATRIRLRNENQTIFRIGGCTYNVTVRDLEMLGNTAMYVNNETPRNYNGDYGIEAMGKWALNPDVGNASQLFKFENIIFQAFDKAIYVHNAISGRSCNDREQACLAWQFDYVSVDHCYFINNKSGIWINTQNTDWKISNSVFSYIASEAPGDGIHIDNAGTVLVEQSWGAGYNYGSHIGGTFIWVGTLASLVVINSGSERGQRSIYVHPNGAISSVMVNVIGGSFGDKIELTGRMNYISSGSNYGPTTIQADPGVVITSTGDRFCYDPLILPGRCVDEQGRAVNKPGFGNGRVMFRTGRLAEGQGTGRIDRQPNFFGYDVEIGDGLLQFDPDIGFADISAFAKSTEGGPRVKDGAFLYCKDCKKDNSGICTQGRAGTDGAFAKRINGNWRCD